MFPQLCSGLAGKDYSQTFCNLNPAETKLFPAQCGIRTSPLVSTQRNPPAEKRSVSFWISLAGFSVTLGCFSSLCMFFLAALWVFQSFGESALIDLVSAQIQVLKMLHWKVAMQALILLTNTARVQKLWEMFEVKMFPNFLYGNLVWWIQYCGSALCLT